MRHLLVPLAVVALAAGCTPAVAPTGSPSVFASPTASATPSPTPSPSPTAVESFPPAPATESPEQAEIRAAWMDYWGAFDRFARDPDLSDLSDTQRVTTGEAQDTILTALRGLREANMRTMGGLLFRDVEVEDPSRESDGLEFAIVQYCLDRSGVENIDTVTGERVAIEGPLTWPETMRLEKGLDGRWRAAQIRSGAGSC